MERADDMALAKVGRKIKRTGKSAVQFKFTATFEYIDVECTGAWCVAKLCVCADCSKF